MTTSKLKTKFLDLEQVLDAAQRSIDVAKQIGEDIETEVDHLRRNARAEERTLIKQEIREVHDMLYEAHIKLGEAGK